jgi:alpha-D-ribose 1-methylphosphonate 5-triphosphate synthase subunit PhnH
MFAEAIEGGFADPVFDAQSIFRAVMDAMARPGTVMPVGPFAKPPAPLSATAAAVALTLCDHDTPVWLDSQLAATAAVYSWLGFHAGAPLVDMPSEAAFALAASPAGLPPLDHFAQGTQEYPDRSTTLILQVDALSSGIGAGPRPYPLPMTDGERGSPTPQPPSQRSRREGKGEERTTCHRLDGPGIATSAALAVAPLPPRFVAQWQENRARFPRGVDVILAAPGALACLPRSVRIELEG